jgi:hypothetical protein
MSSFTFAEFVSATCDAANLRDFVLAIRTAEMRICGNYTTPMLMNIDCAPQLRTASLEAFAGDGHCKSAIKYTNVVMHVLLRCNYRRAGGEDKREVARESIAILERNFGTMVHLCDSHVWLATTRWARDKERSAFMRTDSRLQNIFSYAFSKMTQRMPLAESIAMMAALIAIFKIDRIDCGSYDVDSLVSNGHNPAVAVDSAIALEALVRREASQMMVSRNEDMDSKVREELSKADGKESYLTPSVAEHAIAQASSHQFFQTYLSRVDKKRRKGTVRVTLTYGYSKEVSASATPKNIGGIETEVDLPFDGSKGIENPFKSSAVESYLVEQWLKIIPLISGDIIDNIEIARDVILSLSNAHSESLMREMKDKRNPENKFHLSEPATYINKRYHDRVQERKLFVQEHGQMAATIARRYANSMNRQMENQSIALSSDAAAEMEINQSNAAWAQNNWAVAEGLLKDQLETIFRSLDEPARYQTDQQKILEKFAKDNMNYGFLSYPCYLKWIKGTYRKLNHEEVEVITRFIEHHTSKSK